MAGPGAEAHGSAHLLDAGQLAELIDDAVGRGGIELAGVCAGEAGDVARVLDAAVCMPRQMPKKGVPDSRA